MKIPKIQFKDKNKIPQLGFGTWRLIGNDVKEPLKTALDIGYTHIDTAEKYKNQKEIGFLLRDYDRKKLFITSKLWVNNFNKNSALKSMAETLKELRTDYVDLFLMHFPSKKVSIEETLEILQNLKEAGKAKSIGVSNFEINHLEAALESGAEIVNNQVEFHPMLFQKDLLDFCRKHEIKITAYCPNAMRRVMEMPLLSELKEKYNKTQAQLALKWLVQKGIIVIPKSTKPHHIKENMEIFTWSLSREDEKTIDDLGDDMRLIDHLMFWR